MTEKQVTDRTITRKTGDRQDDYLLIHGSKVIVLSVTRFFVFLATLKMRLPRGKKKKMITTPAEFKKSLDTGSWGTSCLEDVKKLLWELCRSAPDPPCDPTVTSDGERMLFAV